MATKKIILNELRSLVKQINKETDSNASQKLMEYGDSEREEEFKQVYSDILKIQNTNPIEQLKKIKEKNNKIKFSSKIVDFGEIKNQRRLNNPGHIFDYIDEDTGHVISIAVFDRDWFEDYPIIYPASIDTLNKFIEHGFLGKEKQTTFKNTEYIKQLYKEMPDIINKYYKYSVENFQNEVMDILVNHDLEDSQIKNIDFLKGYITGIKNKD